MTISRSGIMALEPDICRNTVITGSRYSFDSHPLVVFTQQATSELLKTFQQLCCDHLGDLHKSCCPQ